MRDRKPGIPCNRWIRIGVIALGVVLVVIALALYGVYHTSEARLTRQYDIGPVPSLSGGDSARGAHLVNAVSLCSRCHAGDFGGQVMADNLVFRAAAPNLTRGVGGRPATWSEADWNRAIRHGLGGQGNSLLVMPADAYNQMSDEDLRAIVAYLRSVKPVDRTVPPSQMKLFGRMLMAAGALDEIAAERIQHLVRAPESTDPTDGAYLSRIAGCTFCHQADFRGRTEPVGPPGAPIPPSIRDLASRGWTLADFSRAVRQGRRPDHSEINKFMPWSAYAGMTDAEIAALWLTTQKEVTNAQYSRDSAGGGGIPGSD